LLFRAWFDNFRHDRQFFVIANEAVQRYFTISPFHHFTISPFHHFVLALPKKFNRLYETGAKII
jgi:hypothetical protein